ncbi:ATP-binding protein [Nostoc sp. PCC 7107]|uniref:ATP-binding protein n=1 Tax=Nostoc sp. PCC 7107 TaxID=317936 RepID=UPI00029EFED6|nr:ATP-binding protein [Nostoc sp. PCC 7107]AFY45690.1 type IIA topoisomerase (DNA gyrase/topo II, topoisomerase IV), B subunit [Nostoc sp. PCC 7107]
MTNNWSHIEESNAIIRRGGIYFGRGVRGTEQFVYELVSNVLDAYLAHQATFVNVTLDGATISVVDDGPGLPFDEPSDIEGVSLATKFLTSIHRTRSYNEHVPHVHMARLGVGLAPINATSIQLTVQSWRSGMLWEQSFNKGIAQGSAKIIEQGNGRGTKIEVTPDPELFRQTQPRVGIIRRALFDTAHLFAGLRIGLNEERFYAPQGLKMLGYIFLTRQTDANNEPFHVTLHHENILIEAAAFGDRFSPTQTFSWVNGARTPDDGSHVEGFSQALAEVNWKPALSLIHIVMYDPRFAGPTRDRLDVPHIKEVIQEALREPLSQYRSELT